MIRVLFWGDILDAHTDAHVNPVNTVGVAGRGLADYFRFYCRWNFAEYMRACKNGHVEIGKMFVTERPPEIISYLGPKLIINFPTKQHWRNDSKIEWIKWGLVDLARVIEERSIRSIAIPALGCGLGGLNWEDVRPLIEATVRGIDGLDATLYAPQGRST